MNAAGHARRALIGHSGFVGSNLAAAGTYTDRFNSTNFREMAGRRFDEVVCAAIPAVKWIANKNPDEDWASISRLLDVLDSVTAGRFTLISTIDVYPDPGAGLDESARLAGLPNHAYGRHRLAVEEWIAERFPHHAIVRLPALFGRGLKKNVLFDLLTGNEVEKINPASVFQWYPLERIGRDVEKIQSAGLNSVNLFTEPVPTAMLLDRFFPGARVGPAVAPASRYDLRTRHAGLFGGADGYVMERNAVLAAMGRFIAEARGIDH